MNFRVVFRAEARADYAQAARWYEDRAPGVGYRFVERVEETITVLEQTPLRSGNLFSTIRRIKTRGFPYFLYFTVENSMVVIIAVLHARRSPAVWRRRGS